MKNIPIEQAAKHYGIAKIRIDQLIRKGVITKCVEQRYGWLEPRILVSTDEIDEYFQINPHDLTQWQEAFQITQNSISKRK